MHQSFGPGRAFVAQNFFLPALVLTVSLSGCSGGSGAAPPSSVPEAGAGALAAQRIMQSQSSTGSRASATYRVLLLATLGGNTNNAASINARSQITGWSLLKGNKVERAELWRSHQAIDLGTLGGPNSSIVNYNHGTRGQFVGAAEVSQTDPYTENFCGFGTSHICLGFSWQNGKMTPLPTLGGNNAAADDVSNHGEVVGLAETSTQDKSCPPPQVLDYYGVIWKPNGKIVPLAPLSGDTVSQAYTMNRSGQTVGWSGLCNALGAHALLWQAGSTINLGTLGGHFNIAVDINDSGQIVGDSDLSGDTATHAFLWQSGAISDLGTLPGDTNSYADGINEKGQIVGSSCSASSCRGFLWQNGSMTDLNLLVPPNKNLYVVYAADINDAGQIPAVALDRKGLQRGIVLIPDKNATVLPAGASAPKFVAQQSLRIRPHNASVAPTTLRKSMFSR